MSTHRVLLLSASICAAIAPACGGRSGLDDFANGSNNIIVGSGNGDDDGKDGGAGGAGDGGAGVANDDGGTAADGGDEPGNGGEREVGEKCEQDKQCGDEGATCVAEVEIFGGFGIEFPGGYCSVQECQDDGDCPDGSGCFDSLGQPICLQLCEGDDECRTDEGYQCGSIGQGGPGGGGGGQDSPSYCLPPFGGMPGGNNGDMGNDNGGMDVTQLCSFVCQDPISIQICMAQNDLNVCMGGGGGNFGGN